MKIRNYTFQEYLDLVRNFHGHLAPGMVCGGFMIDLAYQNLKEGGFYDAISETPACIPDAVQILTPCTIGNGWLKIINTGRFALILYDKYTGEGVRIAIDPGQLEKWDEIKTWALKLKPKREQDSALLYQQIEEAGTSLYKAESFIVSEHLRGKKKNTSIFICQSCGESFRAVSGTICPACTGEAALSEKADSPEAGLFKMPVTPIPLAEAEGQKALHDMTLIIPRQRKGPYIRKGEIVGAEHLETLSSMGKETIYTDSDPSINSDWIHEDDAAKLFAAKMAGDGIVFTERPEEGKINFNAADDGLLAVDSEKLRRFNSVSGVMCATVHSPSPVKKGELVAGTRAIPLFLEKKICDHALSILDGGLFKILPYKRSRVGIVVTGSEVYNGKIKDGFIPIITEKVSRYGCSIEKTAMAPDDRKMIRDRVLEMVGAGLDVIIVTGGLSVDPDDVTRFALSDAGISEYRYSMPVLPGAMTMTGKIKETVIAGVPAGALFSKETAFDRILPVMLASWDLVKKHRGEMGEGGLLITES